MKGSLLKKDINFITAQDLLQEVRNELRSFHERSVLDDSYFYPVIRLCLSKLGAKIYPIGNDILYVNEYKASLPKDFHKLVLALGCFDYTIKGTPDYDNPKLYDVSEAQLKDYLISKPSETCLDECGENFYVIQRFETFDVTYSEFCPLKLSTGSSPYCVNNCFNKNILSQNQIEVSKGQLTTNFRTGSIYIDYLQNLEHHDSDGVDLLIPDFAQIREWIKTACIKKGFEVIYYNNDGDVQQRLNYIKNELTILEASAKSFVNRSELSELYDLRKLFFGRYNKFNEVVYGQGRTYLPTNTFYRR